LVELPVKALTSLFKENPQPLSTTITQNSASAESGSHKLQPSGGAGLSVREESGAFLRLNGAS
jgi:hypothetical protein